MGSVLPQISGLKLYPVNIPALFFIFLTIAARSETAATGPKAHVHIFMGSFVTGRAGVEMAMVAVSHTFFIFLDSLL